MSISRWSGLFSLPIELEFTFELAVVVQSNTYLLKLLLLDNDKVVISPTSLVLGLNRKSGNGVPVLKIVW